MKKTIGIFRTGGIGDVILSTVSVSVIKFFLPDAQIIWFGRKEGNDLIERSFSNITTIEIPLTNSYAQNWQLIKGSASHIDAVLDLQRSARTILLGNLTALHFGCSYTTWNKFSMKRTMLVLQSRIRGRTFKFDLFKENLLNRHEAMATCTLHGLKKTGIRINQNLDFYPTLNSSKNPESRSVSICLGSKFELKALPSDWVNKFILKLVDTNKVDSINFLGEKNQRETADSLIRKFNVGINFTNRCGETSLYEAAAILRESRFALVNDSGLAHLSESVATPVLMFFGPTHEKFGYRPYLKKSRSLSANLGCRPCSKNGNAQCRYNDRACSTLLDEKYYYQLIDELMHG